MLSSPLVRSVLDSLPDAMVIIDDRGHILFANHQVSEMFGHANADLIGGPVEVLLPERFRHRHIAHRTGYTDNLRVRPMGAGLELFAVRKDGTEFPVEISLSPIAQDQNLLVAAAIRDVTERKRADREIREARRDADVANLAKGRFLATASHDLRQPLQALGLLNGALRRMVSDADCQEIIDQQELAVDTMARLLNALLDISKLESGAVKPEPADFEIAPLFEELRREFAGMAATKGLRFSSDAPSELAHSDLVLVGQILRNLMSNAIKYTNSGSVELRCERRGPAVYIEVRDTGVGIAADQLPFIFDEFYQIGVSPNSSREGFGLGLSIVHRIARLLEIRIDVQPNGGQGTVFSFELPAAGSAGAAAPAARHRASSIAPCGSGFHVLLVEDEPAVCNAMRMLLKIEGYQVTTSPSAAHALEQLRSGGPFDLIITDFHLEPGRTGTEVIAAAREQFGDSLKAILVTGDTSSAVRELQSDARLRITRKPINSDELLGLVNTLLGP